MCSSEPRSRPVYVLGAGFSKAISDAMPVTNELGKELQHRLAGIVELDLRAGQSFEDWLTLQITPLPFLERHANARRAASAERVIAEIAHVLDERVADASAQACDETHVLCPRTWVRASNRMCPRNAVCLLE